MDSSPDLVQTPGPWRWRQPAGSRTLELVHPRGVLYVLSACRAGMNDATLLFAKRTAPDRGGILTKLEVRKGRCSDYLADDELTPDLRLIAEAPTLKARVEELEAKLAELVEDRLRLRSAVERLVGESSREALQVTRRMIVRIPHVEALDWRAAIDALLASKDLDAEKTS